MLKAPAQGNNGSSRVDSMQVKTAKDVKGMGRRNAKADKDRVPRLENQASSAKHKNLVHGRGGLREGQWGGGREAPASRCQGCTQGCVLVAFA